MESSTSNDIQSSSSTHDAANTTTDDKVDKSIWDSIFSPSAPAPVATTPLPQQNPYNYNYPAAYQPPFVPQQASMSQNTLLGIGAGVVGLVLLVVLMK